MILDKELRVIAHQSGEIVQHGAVFIVMQVSIAVCAYESRRKKEEDKRNNRFALVLYERVNYVQKKRTAGNAEHRVIEKKLVLHCARRGSFEIVHGGEPQRNKRITAERDKVHVSDGAYHCGSFFTGAHAHKHENDIEYEHYGNYVEEHTVKHRVLIVVV